jgi:predicted XRE-type DNA-binding protein
MTEEAAVHGGTGNVFADLGLPNPEERQLKAQLAYRIAQLIAARKLTQTSAAATLGVSQPKVSALVNGELAGFSVERLLRRCRRTGCGRA